MKKVLLLISFLLTINLAWSQYEGDLFFETPVIHDIRITMHQNNYWDSLEAAYLTDVYLAGDVEIDGQQLPFCGVKFKGNSSYNNPSNKKSWKIDFNEYINGQNYNGLKKLNLNNGFKDPTFMREKLMLDFLNYKGLPVPRCTYARVYLNNMYWGLYTAVEEIDKLYLQNNFGDKKGNLFKGDPSGDLKWLGNTVSNYYSKYELKTNETQNDWTDLLVLIDKINNTPAGSLEDTLTEYFDLDTYYQTWAAHVLFSNLDSYLGSGHNYYLYHDSITNKFRFITWDVNEAFGNFNMGMNVAQIENMNIFFTPMPSGNRPLHERLLQNNSAKQNLANALCEMIHFDFSIWSLEAKIDSLANAIRADVYADSLKFFSNQNFEDNIHQTITVSGTPGGNNLPGLKSFLINRRNSVASQLSSWSCSVGISESESQALITFPNPVDNLLFLNGTLPGNTIYFISDVSGKVIMQGTLNSNSIVLPEEMNTGFYFIRLNNPQTNSSQIQKFLKL